MHELINVALIAVIALCLYRTYRWNLFQCALFLGRTLFALLLAMALFEPLSQRAVGLVNLPVPYLKGMAFFLIWVLVLWGFQRLAVGVLRETGRDMEFRHESPGRVLVGLLSGFLVGGALSVNLVMLPAIEGLYFENRALPIAGLHRPAGAVYRTLTLTSTDLVTLAQMDAGAHWAEEEMNQMLREGDTDGAERLIGAFEARYRRHIDTKDVRKRRDEILVQLLDALKQKAE